MALDAYYWENYFRNAIIPEVRMYAQVIEKRLLPIFDTIEQEADVVANWTGSHDVSGSWEEILPHR
jgi:hypothetical protein